MTRIITLLCLLAISSTGHAALKLLLNGQELIVQTSVLDTTDGELVITSGENLTCTGFTLVDPAMVPLAIRIDNVNQIAEIDNVTPGAFTIERLGTDTVITVNTIGGTMSCSSVQLPEVFFRNGFEDALGF